MGSFSKRERGPFVKKVQTRPCFDKCTNHIIPFIITLLRDDNGVQIVKYIQSFKGLKYNMFHGERHFFYKLLLCIKYLIINAMYYPLKTIYVACHYIFLVSVIIYHKSLKYSIDSCIWNRMIIIHILVQLVLEVPTYVIQNSRN